MSDQVVDSAAVENLILVLTKGLRAIQLYLPNNPIYQKAVDNVRAAFAPVWEEVSELELHVTETNFLWEDVVVYTQPSKADSFAWLFYKDGVRTVTLLPGVENEEIVRFLEVIQKAAALPTDATDDLLTLLWEEDFLRIRHTALELDDGSAPALEPSASGWRAGTPPEAEQVRQQIVQEAQQATAAQGIVSLEDFDSTLYFLDDGEIAHIKSELEREYGQDLRGNVLAMLFDLLELQTFTAVRSELISITENFIPYLLGVGDFRSVAYVLRELKAVLERARELIREHERQLSELPARLSQPEALGQLLQSLDEAVVHPSEEELGDLFGELRPEALTSVLQWLPRLANQRVRGILERAAHRLAASHPDQLTKALDTEDEAVLLQTIRIIGQLHSPPLVPVVGRLLKHKNSHVRREVVAALAAIGSPSAMKEMECAIDDPDRDVRISAARTLSERGHRGAFARVDSAIRGRALRAADLTEKTAFFEAYGRLAGDGGISNLRAMLLGKGLLRKKEDPETRACAAMALGTMREAAARDVLIEAASREKDPLVKNAINRALQGRE